MKGIDNNEEAKKLAFNMMGVQSNKIRNLYNLGYKQGFEDGLKEAMDKIIENIIGGDTE